MSGERRDDEDEDEDDREPSVPGIAADVDPAGLGGEGDEASDPDGGASDRGDGAPDRGDGPQGAPDAPGSGPSGTDDDEGWSFDAVGRDPEDGGTGSAEPAGAESAGRSGPMGDLADSLDERDHDAEPPEDVFSEEEVAEIDADVVWERLEADETDPEPSLGAEPTVRVIDAGAYCEQCPYFSEPPDVSCTHDGTEIRELVGMDQFRVVDCPKVAENERLEQL